MRLGRSLFAIGSVVALLAAGCHDHNSKTNTFVGDANSVSNPDPPRNLALITGRVVDNATRQGIGFATVAARFTATDIPTTQTLSQSGNTGFDQTGGFTIAFDPRLASPSITPPRGERRATTTFVTTTTFVVVAITSPGYATRQVCVPVSINIASATTQIFDAGLIEMNKAITFQVLATLDGTPLPNVNVFAVPTQVPCLDNPADISDKEGLGGQIPFEVELVATTDANGIALFQGIDPLRNYEFLVPAQDFAGNQLFNSTTGENEPFNNNTGRPADLGQIPQPLVIAMTSFKNTPAAIQVLKTDLASSTTLVGEKIIFNSGPIVTTGTGNNVFNDNVVGNEEGGGQVAYDGFLDGPTNTDNALVAAGQTIRVVFNEPVDVLASAPAFHFFDDLSSPPTTSAGITRADQFPGPEKSVGVTTTKFANGTLWLFTPSAPLKKNETFVLQIFVRAAGNPQSTLNSIEPNGIVTTSGALLLPFYVPGPALSTGSITLDNYNGTTTGTGLKSQVYLQFPTFVVGSYKILSATDQLQPNALQFDSASQVIDFQSSVDNFHLDTDSTALDPNITQGSKNDTDNVVSDVNSPLVDRLEMVFSDGTAVVGGGPTNSPFASPVNGIRFRVPLLTETGVAGPARSLQMNDNSPTNTSQVTFEIFAMDLLGNTVSGAFTLPVQ